MIPGGFGERGIEGKIAAAGYAREHDIPCLGLCLGLQVMTIEFARNVLGLTGANSTRVRPARTPHPVIDLMDDQRDVTDMGGTMRLGAYVRRARAGLAGAPRPTASTVVSERHRHRYEFNPRYRARFEDGGLRAARARRPTAGWSSSSSCDGHPFWVGTQAHPEFKSRPDRPAPAVPRAHRRRPGAGRGPRARTSSTSTHEPPVVRVAPDAEPAFRHARRAGGRTGATVIARRRGHASRRPTATDVRARRRPPPGRRRRSCRCCDDGDASSLVRQYRGRARRSELLEIPAGMRDVDGEADRGDRRTASWRRRSACGPGASSCSPTFYNVAGHHRRASGWIFLATDLTRGAPRPAGPRGGAHDGRAPRRSHDVPAMIADGRITDAKTIIGLSSPIRRLRRRRVIAVTAVDGRWRRCRSRSRSS